MASVKTDPSRVVLLALLAALAGLYSCDMNCIKGEGPVVGADKSVEEFAQLEVNVPAEVYVFTGDVNADNAVNLADAITSLNYLFQNKAPPSCFKSGDTNDDGSVNLADAITSLGYVFQNGAMTAPDGTAIGPENVGCASYLPEAIQDVVDEKNPDPCVIECSP